MSANTRRVVRISKRKLVRLLAFILIILVAYFGILFFGSRSSSYERRSGGGIQLMDPESGADLKIGKPENVGISMPSAPDQSVSRIFRNDEKVPITDTREFLKASYHASIKSRSVQDVVNQAKNIVKGNDGRVDSISSSEKYGYLTFVVPKSKFEAFQTDIEGLTHKKLISVSSTSQNLLSDKQRIEGQMENLNNTLEELRQQKETLLASHTQTVASTNKELTSIRSQLSAVRKTIAETQDEDTLNTLRAQESSLVSRESTQKQKLATENTNFNNVNTILENQIKYQNANLEDTNTQDTNFTENIETVDGSIDVRWVSIWQLIKIFSPVPAELLVVVLVLVGWNILAKLNYVPKFILE